MNDCWMCEGVFGPKEINGVRQLQTFRGYTVDFKLRQFRKVLPDALPEFIEFDSPEGKKLCDKMHEASMDYHIGPRRPTKEEKTELLEHIITNKYLGEPTEEDRQDDAYNIENSVYIAVFDRYSTCSPGYAGKVMVVVW